MAQFIRVLHYLWATVRFLYECATKMSISTWFYLFVATFTLIGSYCIMHIMRDLWTTIGAIIMFVPKLYIKLVNYLMNFVDAPHCHYRDHAHHSHQRPPPTTPPTSESSSERLYPLCVVWSYPVELPWIPLLNALYSTPLTLLAPSVSVTTTTTTVIMTFQFAHPFKAHDDTIAIPKDKQRDVEDVYRW